MLDEFQRRDPTGDLDRIYAEIVKKAPSLKLAETNVVQAQSDLDQAKLNLSYCSVFAEIDGVITRRNVNPGNNVQVGESLVAIRSLRFKWPRVLDLAAQPLPLPHQAGAPLRRPRARR
jgi:membrane fusion protein, multidrug efflux system